MRGSSREKDTREVEVERKIHERFLLRERYMRGSYREKDTRGSYGEKDIREVPIERKIHVTFPAKSGCDTGL